ncbi:MAG: hypothetical protein ABL958_19490, partial [Bdellovibrionia bacterium]
LVPSYYLESSISERLRNVAIEELQPSRPLPVSKLAQKILKKRRYFERQKSLTPRERECRIFESYSDPAARVLFESYGMIGPASASIGDSGVQCYPWVALGPGAVLVRDPHRGRFLVKLPPKVSGKQPVVPVRDWMGTTCLVGRKFATRLVSLGLSHPSPQPDKGL